MQNSYLAAITSFKAVEDVDELSTNFSKNQFPWQSLSGLTRSSRIELLFTKKFLAVSFSMVTSCYHPISSYPRLPDFFGCGGFALKTCRKTKTKEKIASWRKCPKQG